MIKDNAIKASDICAVMTTFNPTDSIEARVFALLEQLGSVVIVNDSGRSDVAEHLDLLFNNSDRLTLIHNEYNSGIAASLNRGVKEAKEQLFDWVVTLDDDSDITATFIDDLIKLIKECDSDSVGVYSLSRFLRHENNLQSHVFLCKRAVITSGCIFSIGVFESVGGFDESLFIDLVDYDFCTNVRRLGLKVVQSNLVGMKHAIGASEIINIFGCRFNIYNHRPFRNYYQIRNSIRFAQKHLRYDFLLSVSILCQVFFVPFKAIFFEDLKISRMYYCLLGFFHGIVGRGGPLNK